MRKKTSLDELPSRKVTTLYRKPMRATRGGALFNAFPYPTKISPETIALFIASHTKPGDTVFDCFAGSGTTGLGAILCARPTDNMRQEAGALGLSIRWGPRHAILCEVGVLGSFVAKVLCLPPDPGEFLRAAEKLMRSVEEQYAWLYEARDPKGQTGHIRHVIWTDVLQCSKCRKHISLWNACVTRNPAEISGTFRCTACGHETPIEGVHRVTEEVEDALLGKRRKVRRRLPAWIYGSTNGRTWARPFQPSDAQLLRRIEKEPIPHCVPQIAIPWGDLYRSGYHEGITHLHHFYTCRNLIAFSTLWEQIRRQPPELQDALRFWLLSYNASHTTIMTRVVAKRGQKDLVVTSAQSGVLYVSGLPVEKNVFAGLRRKLKTISEAFEIAYGNGDLVDVRNVSSASTGLPDASADYIFTDPPFGGNIPYAEVNFLNEAWLGKVTNPADEVTVSHHQGKKVNEYRHLLYRSLREAYRLLRNGGKATVVFHSSSAQIWNALREACDQAGFSVTLASILDKAQGSFKQVTCAGAVQGDPLILLTKSQHQPNGSIIDVWEVARNLLRQATASKDPAEMTPQRIYSRLVAYYVTNHREIPIDARDFYRQFALRQGAHEYATTR